MTTKVEIKQINALTQGTQAEASSETKITTKVEIKQINALTHGTQAEPSGDITTVVSVAGLYLNQFLYNLQDVQDYNGKINNVLIVNDNGDGTEWNDGSKLPALIDVKDNYVKKAGDTMSGDLTLPTLNAQSVKVKGQEVYSPSNKPTASDVGALPANGKAKDSFKLNGRDDYYNPDNKPTPSDLDVYSTNEIDNKINDIESSVNNLHTTRKAIEWRAGLNVTEPLQLYVHEGVEYFPKASEVPFMTSVSFDNSMFELSLKFQQWRDIGDIRGWGAKLDGVTDDSDALVKVNLNCKKAIITGGVCKVKKDTHIINITTFKIERDALISVDNGVTLTWDAEIDAGWYQIFDMTGTIKPTNRLHNTPTEHRYNGNVKSSWFGVINDAVFPTNYKEPSIPAPIDGQLPTGTDSTLAFKRAFAFCQYGSYKNGHYVVQFERVALEFEPNSQILLKGSNLFNEQIYLTELDALEREADRDGGNFLAMSEYQKVGVFNVTIEGNNSTILWHPENEHHVFSNIRQLISNFEINDLSVVPVGITAAQFINGYGYFLTNNALIQKGGSPDEYFNSLSYQQFTRLNVMLPSIGLPNSGVSTDGAFKWLFGYLGYSLGDRLHLKECKFNGFDKVVYCQNPESVEFNATGCSFRSKRNNATFFHYLSFYGQFRIEGSGIFMKGENQTLLHTDDDVGISKFSDTAEFSLINNRMETGNKNKVTLIKGEYGRFMIKQLNPNYGSNGITTDSVGVHLEKSASVILENVNVPTNSELYRITPENKFPLWFKHCNFYARDNIDSIRYSDNGNVYKNYKYAISQGDNVPAVVFENCPVYTTSGNVIDAPRVYGGKDILAADIESAELKVCDSQGYERINGKSFIMPRYCVVTQMRLNIKAMTGTFADSVKVSFGGLVKTHPLNGGRANDIDLLSTPIALPAADEKGRTITIEYQKEGVTVEGGSPAIATIRYRCAQGKTELTGEQAYEPWT